MSQEVSREEIQLWDIFGAILTQREEAGPEDPWRSEQQETASDQKRINRPGCGKSPGLSVVLSGDSAHHRPTHRAALHQEGGGQV